MRIVSESLRPGVTVNQVAIQAGNRAAIASLIGTGKLDAVDPIAYPTNTLTAIVNGYKQSRIDHLLPWNYVPKIYRTATQALAMH